MNPGYMNATGGYAEKSMGRGLKGLGASKAGIDGRLVNLLDRVRPQAISKEIKGHHQLQMPEVAAGREVITFILGVAGTPSLQSSTRLVPLRAC